MYMYKLHVSQPQKSFNLDNSPNSLRKVIKPTYLKRFEKILRVPSRLYEFHKKRLLSTFHPLTEKQNPVKRPDIFSAARNRAVTGRTAHLQEPRNPLSSLSLPLSLSPRACPTPPGLGTDLCRGGAGEGGGGWANRKAPSPQGPLLTPGPCCRPTHPPTPAP